MVFLFMLCALLLWISSSLSALLKPVNLGNIIYLGVGAPAICFVTRNYAVKVLRCYQSQRIYIYGDPGCNDFNVDPSSMK